MRRKKRARLAHERLLMGSARAGLKQEELTRRAKGNNRWKTCASICAGLLAAMSGH